MDIRHRTVDNYTPYNVFKLINRINYREIEIDEEIKDGEIEKFSFYIEALIHGLPICSIVIDERREKNRIILGEDFIRAIYLYIKKEKYVLSGLVFDEEFNGKKYSELSRRYTRYIEEVGFPISFIREGSDEFVDMIYKRYNEFK